MLLSNEVEIKWNSKIKKRYVDLGYKFTKMGEPFLVDIKDVSKGSNSSIKLKCDYCGKIFEVKTYTYFNLKKECINLDCCGSPKCTGRKSSDVLLKKYGVANATKMKSSIEKMKKTNLEKYGCENVFQNEEIKEKSKNTMLEKYGVEYPLMSNDFLDKAKKTCIKNFGVEYGCIKPNIKSHIKGKNNPRWIENVEYERKERATNEYIYWRKEVFGRDVYACQKCNQKNGNGKTIKLCAHHILNWKDNEDFRYDINNGITLCEECHKLFHKIYGKKNTTQQQIEDFLKY